MSVCRPSLAHFPAGNQVFDGDSGEQEVMVSVLIVLAVGSPAPPPLSDPFARSCTDAANKSGREAGSRQVSEHAESSERMPEIAATRAARSQAPCRAGIRTQ